MAKKGTSRKGSARHRKKVERTERPAPRGTTAERTRSAPTPASAERVTVVCPWCRGEFEGPLDGCPVATCRGHDTPPVVSLAGQVVDDRYEVVSILGRGGFATVWLAVHTRTKERVALKVLEGARDVAERIYHHELRVTSAITSAHVVAARDGGQLADGRYFLVMEYVEGSSLADVLRHYRQNAMPVPWRSVAHIGHQVSLALEAAHRAGVLHLDLKPSNLLMTETDGDPEYIKILDFGFARIVEPDGRLLSVLPEGQAAGTPAYMAPELLDPNARVDARADLFSLGAVLYEALTGELPYGPSVPNARESHTLRPARSLRPDAPVELTRTVDAMLALDAAKRPASARKVRIVFQQVESKRSSILDLRKQLRQTRETGSRWRRWIPFLRDKGD